MASNLLCKVQVPVNINADIIPNQSGSEIMYCYWSFDVISQSTQGQGLKCFYLDWAQLTVSEPSL